VQLEGGRALLAWRSNLTYLSTWLLGPTPSFLPPPVQPTPPLYDTPSVLPSPFKSIYLTFNSAFMNDPEGGVPAKIQPTLMNLPGRGSWKPISNVRVYEKRSSASPPKNDKVHSYVKPYYALTSSFKIISGILPPQPDSFSRNRYTSIVSQNFVPETAQSHSPYHTGGLSEIGTRSTDLTTDYH
jgi:hypothetical protein